MHLESLIEDALDISRLENNQFKLDMEAFDISAAIREIIEIMQFQVKSKTLDLRVTLSETIPVKIVSDQKRLKQVLFNLIGNAIKFTFQGYIAVKANYYKN